MKKKYSFCIFLFCIMIICPVIQSCGHKSGREVKIELNGKNYTFELARTDEERRKGLMFRKKLPKNGGMLFVYSMEKPLHFYMKNTFIPLDIAFIDSRLTIIGIHQMEPLDETTVSSGKKVLYALEVNRGFFERIGVKEGDAIKILTPIKY